MANTKGTSVISAPSSGGSQSGLGETFSPDLFTGTGNYSVPISIPPGRNGFQPQLSLNYSSGKGNGIFGAGWGLGIPGVTRKTSRGIPVYDDKSDIFIISGAEDLVPVACDKTLLPGNIGYEQTTYRPRTEGLFARIIRHKKTSGEHYWEVRTKDGLVNWYGTPGLTSDDPAVIANPESRQTIFSWLLTKTTDTFGNTIVYEYDRDLVTQSDVRAYDQLYVSKIKYAQYPDGGDTKYLCEIRFVYEDRPDPFSQYRQGFEIRTIRRCIAIETYTNATALIKTRTYHFNYKTTLPANGSSLLESINVEGHNGDESELMPPLEFSYSDFDTSNKKLQEVNGPIPDRSIGDPGYELVDLTGNGLPDLLQLNGVARYWPNLGNGLFGNSRSLDLAPSVDLGTPGVQLIDANGDGRMDLLFNDGYTSGYFPGEFHEVWNKDSFRTYQYSPSFTFSDPEVHLIDLDGDGITDVLRNGTKFECYYNHPDKGFYKVSTAEKLFANFSFADSRIRFADMTGDGLQDIVLISSGRVQYWPNMGYGKFGKMINMINAPVFPDQYDPKQILISDVDGDGQADIVFIENNSVTVYINQSGNGFSQPIKIFNTPRIYDLNSIRIVDILGDGQAGILWSFGTDALTPGRMFFLNFTGGNKSYLLEEMNNNLGSITRVKYNSSVYHYLRDQSAITTRWKTDLPFPVQVVDRIEILDQLSGGKLTTNYKYHHGYWDGFEREFRGFAHVDVCDTETFDRINTQELFTDKNVSPVSVEHYSSPTLTKNWFYLGPVGNGFSKWFEPDFSDEYWSGDLQVLNRSLQMNNLLTSLASRAKRDALRTLRGTLLRTELYALDGTKLEELPYTITENLTELRLEFDPSSLPDPLWSESNGGYWAGGGFIFFPYNSAQRVTQYERGRDPMHQFNFSNAYGTYGQPLGELSVAVPRGLSPVNGMPLYNDLFNGIPANYLATYVHSDYIEINIPGDQYMVDRVKRTLTWDASQGSFNKSAFDLRDSVFTDQSTLPVLGCVLNYYDGDAFIGLDYGYVGVQGAQVRSESLIITDDIISAAYGTNTPQCFVTSPDWTTGYPAAFSSLLQNADSRLGYNKKTGDPYITGWYTESVRLKYDFQDIGLPAEEQLGRVLESKDIFDNLSTIEYDTYLVNPIISKQWLNGTDFLQTSADIDYRIMGPYTVTDSNDNISVFDFSPLGLLKATSVIGKGTEGDYISSTGGYYDKYAPSSIVEYDLFAFKNNGSPTWVKTTNREKHYQDSATSDTVIKVEYNDGFGRLLQTRAQAEDAIFGNEIFGSSGLPDDQNAANEDVVGTLRSGTDPLNVAVTGWKIYNNKGKVVEQYEPFFDKGFDYVKPDTSGVKIKTFYDAIGRAIRIKKADDSEQWTIQGVPDDLSQPPYPYGGGGDFRPTPWINFSYDANDLSEITNPGSSVPSSHWYTPKSTLMDSMGRTIQTIDYFDNTNYSNNLQMNYYLDVRGNTLLVTDPYYRNTFEHIYDLSSGAAPIWTKHIDKGESTVILDSTGKPIETHDSKGAIGLSAYDVLNRPTYFWACNKTGDSITLRNYMIYGDSAGLINPENDNLKSRLYQNYDEAGLVEIPEYDFKGNVLTKNRQVIDSTTLKTYLNSYTSFIVDWTGLPSILDSFVYETDTEYDALNRITKITLPEDVNTNRKEIIPTYNNSGGLQQVSYDGTVYVENIIYNARGQRLLIAYGNSIMTRYVYDPLTFKLMRYRSEKYTKTTSGSTITYAYNSGTTKQDDGFNFDLVGNIIKVLTRVTDCGINGSILGDDALDRNFEHDALYRLTFADGREANTQSGNTYLYNDAPDPGSPNASNVRYYSRDYSYDLVGNIISIVQSGTNGFTRNYTCNTGFNTLQKIEDSTPATIESYTYDNCGNTLTTNLNRHYVWNHADQLICYYNQVGMGTPTVFTQYDYSGQDRVSKLVKTGSDYERTVYIDGIFEYCILESGSTYEKNYVHIIDDRIRIAEIRVGTPFPTDISDSITYHLSDNLGASAARLTTSGTVIDKEEYYPFGDSSLRTFAYKRYRYVGKEKDQESGLYYYGARYYASWISRFISIDPLAGNYPFYTPYNYAGNKPINKIDIDGMQEAEAITVGVEEAEAASETSVAASSEGMMPIFQDTQASNDAAWTTMQKDAMAAQERGANVRITTNWTANGQVSDKTISIVEKDGSTKTMVYRPNNNIGFNPRNSEQLPLVKSPNTYTIPKLPLNNEQIPLLPGTPSASPQNQAASESESEGVGQPGEWESLIPVWGSGRAAVDHFQNGNYWRGIGYTALAISDIFLVKSLITAATKGIFIAGSKIVAKKVAAEEGGSFVAHWGKAFQYAKGGEMTAIEHIMYRHAANSGFSGVSKFMKGTTARMVKSYVDEALKFAKPVLQKDGSYMLRYDLGKTIGAGSNGMMTSEIMIYIRDGWIRTAFPIH